MNQDEIKNVRLFRFKINNTTAVILFYLTLPLILTSLPNLIYFTYSLLEYPALFLTDFISLMSVVTFIVIPIIVTPLLIYIVIVCTSVQKLFRGQENSKVRWLGFRLDKTSRIVIFILSIFYLIQTIQSLISFIGSLLTFIRFSLPPPSIMIMYITSLTISFILLIFYIYTLVICTKNRKSDFNENSIEKTKRINFC